MDTILSRVRQASENSEFLRALAAARRRLFALGGESLRPLTDREVVTLERQGNRADDWSRLRVAEGFDCRRVCDCRFSGDVALGRVNGECSVGGITLPAGLYRSTIVDCLIGHGVLVSDVRLMANYILADRAVVFDCGRVVTTGSTSFGNGQLLSLGREDHRRLVPIYAEMDVDVAAAVAGRLHGPEFLDAYGAIVRQYCDAAQSRSGLIGTCACVVHTPRVENTYVGPHARIDGATAVIESTLLSSEAEPTAIDSGALVTTSLLQWGSQACSMAVLENVVLTEHSAALKHAKVSASLIGPNTTIAEGEVSSSLVGPFVGFHHQALLIAAYWPDGRGNVAAGACVGSNHTTRAPDQEFRPGEGNFFGLGVNIKYPADCSASPYLIVACGVTTAPQRVAFPFALITPAAHRLAPPGLNQIIPAWLLSDSLYTLFRNEQKYQTRNRAQRSRFSGEILRPEIIDLLVDAARRLENVEATRDIYTEVDIPGLGRNYLLEKHRQSAIAAYRLLIRFQAIREHCRRREACPWSLAECAEVIRSVVQLVERSKAKDDERGRRIFADYDEMHTSAESDSIVRDLWTEANRWIAELRTLCRSHSAVAGHDSLAADANLARNLASSTCCAHPWPVSDPQPAESLT